MLAPFGTPATQGGVLLAALPGTPPGNRGRPVWLRHPPREERTYVVGIIGLRAGRGKGNRCLQGKAAAGSGPHGGSSIRTVRRSITGVLSFAAAA